MTTTQSLQLPDHHLERSSGDRPHILIVEANTPESNRVIRAMGGRIYSDIYRSLIERMVPHASIEVAFPNEEPPDEILGRMSLEELDGAVWTGSSLNAYSPDPRIAGQAALFEKLFAPRVPIFGSCWGLQLMTVALGGSVRRNPKGREIGVARSVRLTKAGIGHPMYRAKGHAFDALCTHTDDVETLPAGCLILASNAACRVQAASLEEDGRSFWGVQYHPEFNLSDLALVYERSAAEMVSEGFFSKASEVGTACIALNEIERSPRASKEQRRVYGISDDLIDDSKRQLEIENWIKLRVFDHF